MPTINDFINHARHIDLIKPLKLLASDSEVIKKVESLSDGQVAERNDFLAALLNIFECANQKPTEADMQTLVRAIICSEYCSNLALQKLFFPVTPSGMPELKKEFTVAIMLSVLSRTEIVQKDLSVLLNELRLANKGILFTLEYFNLFLNCQDDEIHYLMHFKDLLIKEIRVRDPFEPLKKCVHEILAGKPFCEWYEKELADAANSKNPDIIKKLLSTANYQLYLRVEYKKRAPQLIAFVIVNDFPQFVERLIGNNPKKLALAMRTAIRANKLVVVMALCKLGALSVSKNTLYEAFQHGHKEIFVLLLKAGANVKETGDLGSMVGDILGKTYSEGKIPPSKYMDMLNLVLETRQFNQDDMRHALSRVIIYDNVDMLNLLIKFDGLQKSPNWAPPLIEAIINDSLAVIPVLLAAGQSLDESYQGKTVWDSINENYNNRAFGSETQSWVRGPDFEAATFVLQQSLREALVQLVQTKDPHANLREMMKTIFEAKQQTLTLKGNKLKK